ncbi:hypothetical protein, partial [Xanthomonas graminis]|uniref:hypothetical protein n=1 Tax=Xanthomonas graminis TaxID=3390026 RepID=UPI001C37894E
MQVHAERATDGAGTAFFHGFPGLRRAAVQCRDMSPGQRCCPAAVTDGEGAAQTHFVRACSRSFEQQGQECQMDELQTCV